MLEVKTFEGDTLLERFKSMEQDGITKENIIDFFGGENSKYLALNMMGGVNEDEYREFYKYFSERHKLNQLFPKVFKENWDQDPVIIRVGKSLM